MDRLEELRRKAAGPSVNVKDLSSKMVGQSQGIHAAFLFEKIGWALRKKLCMMLSGTKPSERYAGWDDLAAELGLNGYLIKCIEYNFQHEDPTSNVLTAYVQSDSATLAKIIDALYKLRRHDVILQIQDDFVAACDAILTAHGGADNGPGKCIRPAGIPECPFIFKSLPEMCEKFDSDAKNINPFDSDTKKIRAIENRDNFLVAMQQVQQAAPATPIKHPRYKKIVMLTFAKDAGKSAKEIAMALRKVRNENRIGVVILAEQEGKLNRNPQQFIYDCFLQVDYVIPVLTPDYIKMVTSADFKDGTLQNVDNLYVNYIYTLMNTYYLRSGCMNLKVRSIIPDDFVHNVYKRSIMGHPLFQVWVKMSEIELLADRIIKGI